MHSRLLLSISVVLVVAVACGGGGGSNQSLSAQSSSSETAIASPTGSAGEPIEVVRATLDALNRQDVDSAYANLSTDARKDVELERVRTALNALKEAGIAVSITIDKVGDTQISGDMAEIELGLTVKFGESTVPVNDTASLVKEDGQWRISDHFLQTALVAVGQATPAVQGTRRLDANGCDRDDPMTGVYAPSRLQILDACVTVEGVVRNDINKAEDGDITFGLFVSGDDRRLVNDVNIKNYDGALHIEIVPMDQQTVLTPKSGDRVRITGPWVTDLVHGHNEIHPAFRIEIVP